jgi:hypothetical protein
MRAEIKAGELLAEMKARGERSRPDDNLRKGPKSRAATSEKIPKLSDLGVSKTQSSRAIRHSGPQARRTRVGWGKSGAGAAKAERAEGKQL